MKKPGGAALIAATLFLAGCSASAPAASETTPAAEPSTVSTPAPPTATATAQAIDAPPAGCLAYEGTAMPHADGGEAVAAAAARAALPPTVILKPGVQTISSVDVPGMVEAVARVCSTPMTEAELIKVANEIAIAVKADPSSEQLAVLVVSGWAPDAAGVLQQGESVTTEFPLYTWDPTAAAPMDSNWE